MTRTQVGIVGAGPAGLVLARLLHLQGIESVVLENRSREYVEQRIRAGVLEQPTVDLLENAGVGERLRRDGIVHHGIELQFDGERHRIPLSDLTGGRSIVIYGQTEVVKDLIASRIDDGLPLHFEVDDVSVHDLESERPRIRYRREGEHDELECDVIAGCDGFHGICRPSIPDGVLRTFEREYPFGWLGILAAVAPSSDELVYAHHERGFALLSLRSPELSRLYVQCRPDEDIAAWSDDRIWSELQQRLGLDGWTLDEGPVLEKGVTGMRSFVTEPMCHGRLYLAGDAAHIVPPTGAKGLNLAIHDVRTLAEALTRLVCRRLDGAARPLLGDMPAARLARRALLVVDDLDAAPLAGARPVRPAFAAVAASLPHELAGRGNVARRELRGARAGLTPDDPGVALGIGRALRDHDQRSTEAARAQRRAAGILDERSQACEARRARLARLDAEACELARGAVGLVVVDDDRAGEAARERRPGGRGRRARIQPGHRRPGRLDRDRTPGLEGCRDARRACRVDRDRCDPSSGRPAHPGAREGSDAGLQQHDVDRLIRRKLCVDLAEERRVAVDHPRSDRARAVQVCVVDRAAGRVARGVGERPAHRLVVVGGDDDELGTLQRDRLPPGSSHRLGDVDRRAQAHERRHAGDGAAVVAVGRRRQPLDALVTRARREHASVRAASEQLRDRP